MTPAEAPDLLLVSLGTTRGLRIADRWFLELAERAGASVAATGTRMGATRHLRRAYPVTDVVEALAARRATQAVLARLRPGAVVFSTSTAALLMPPLRCPYAIRLDAPAALNRPGVQNAAVHAVERRRLARARVVLALSRAGAASLPAQSAPTLVLPVPVEPSPAGAETRERLAVAYTPDPKAKGLDILLAAWGAARPEGARLEVFGIEPDRGRAHLARRGVPEPSGMAWRGSVAAQEFRSTLRRARAFVASARWEDFGQAPLEALTDGALLVCVPSRGPFEALAIARELEPGLVASEVGAASLAAALREAFALPDARVAAYRRAAAALMSAYHPDAVAKTMAREVLPALLPQ